MDNYNRDRRDRGGYNRGGDRGGYRGGGGGFNRRDFGRPQMHRATCSNCGRQCEVPFRPTGEKPVFCNDCFGQTEGRGNNNDFRGKRDSNRYDNQPKETGLNTKLKDELAQINEKLDRVLRALELRNISQEPKTMVFEPEAEAKPKKKRAKSKKGMEITQE